MKSGKKSLSRPGFTLVELMVVIVIIVVLASLSFMIANRAKKAANNAATLNNLREIGTGVGAWMSENGNFYPPCWDNTNGSNRSWAQTLDPYINNEENYRNVNSKFIGPNKRIPVEVNQYSHPITYSMNRAVCRDVTSNGDVKVSLIHSTQVGRLNDVILMADGCQNPSNLGQANASAYEVFSATGATGSRGSYSDKIPVGPDVDESTGDGWFRYPGGKCQALMCDGSARSFAKGAISNRNIWIDREKD
ncbi:prepilin-type N-terminal cleavage/methylation domain-containing protein [Haloferula sp.]|uniref:prepilin-type N-terminal cleavage/methylation domain-containing protein n=1 Tax=Haloferula sp. TaxID=2497595 RepID=UPI0032A0A4FE